MECNDSGGGGGKWRFSPKRVLLTGSGHLTIREARTIIESNLPPGLPRGKIPLAHGDPSIFPCFRSAPEAEEAVVAALRSGEFNSYAPAGGVTAAKRHKAVLASLQADHAQDFLLTSPIDGLGFHMSPVEYRRILRYRLMISLFPADEICPVCRKACLDNFGDHCRELPGFKYRHDLVRDVLFDVLRRASIAAKKVAPVNFLTDPQEGRSTLRPADILIFGWIGGKHSCVDLSGVSPLVGLKSGTFTAGHAALKAYSAKVVKHEKSCMENQHAFIPFGFDTFGFLAPEAVELLRRIQKVMNSNVMSPRSMDVVFRRIGFAIQKGIAAQLVARLSPVLV